MYNDTDCDTLNTIRPTSSSLARGPSWSFGVGASEYLGDNNNGNNNKQRISATNQNHDSQRLSNEATNQPKLDLQIPTVYLTKRNPSKSSFHVYELRIKLLQTNQEWCVYRRYSQFHALHQQLRAKDAAIGKLHFPPKKRLNSKASTIVQERRRKLEDYIKAVNFYIEHLPSESGACDDTDGVVIIEQQNQLRSMLSLGSNSANYIDETSRVSFQSDCISNAGMSDAGETSSTRAERARSIESDDMSALDGVNNTGQSPPKHIRSEGIDEFFDGSKSFEKFSIQMIFNIFISLKDKRDDDFNPESLDSSLNGGRGEDAVAELPAANNQQHSSGT